MKKFKNSLLLMVALIVMFSTSAFAFGPQRLYVGEQLQVSNITGKSEKVYMIDGNGEPLQTYIGKNIVNVIASGEDLDNFIVREILPVDGYWTVCDQVEFAFGGVYETGVQQYTTVNISGAGLYYVASIKDEVKENFVICILGDEEFTTNGYIANYTEMEVKIFDKTTTVTGFVCDYNMYVRIEDIANLYAGSEQEFSINWNENFSLYNLITGEEYTESEVEPFDYEEDEIKLAITHSEEIFKNFVSTGVSGLTVDEESYYSIKDFASAFSNEILVSIVDKTISIK